MKLVKEKLNEVIRAEDEWADREIDRYQGKEVEEPVEPEPYKDSYEDQTARPVHHGEDMEKMQMAMHISSLEEVIISSQNRSVQTDWSDFVMSLLNNYPDPNKMSWKDLTIEDLHEAYNKAMSIVNNLKSSN